MKAFLRLIVAAIVCAVVAGLPVTVVAPGRAIDVRLRATALGSVGPRSSTRAARGRLRSRTIVMAPRPVPTALPALTSLPAIALTEANAPLGTLADATSPVSLASLRVAPLVGPVRGLPVPVRQLRAPRRLVPLYISFGALQVLDYHSTARAIDAGASEGNPIARVLQKQPAAIIAAKAATTVGVVLAGEQLWKRN